MLRVTSLGIRLSALGLSTAFHAAMLFTAVGHPAAPQGMGDVVDVEGLTVLEPPFDLPEAAPTGLLATGRATERPTHVHSSPVSPGRETAHPRLRRSAIEMVGTPLDPNLVQVFDSPSFTKAIDTRPPATHAVRPVTTSSDDTPRFTIAIGKRATEVPGRILSGGTVPGETEADAPMPEDAVDAQARLLGGPAPVYPLAARSEGVEGDVQLEVVVGVSGAVENARVVGAVGHGLDEAALAVARESRFSPARIGGKPVRVRMGWSIGFRLQ